MNSLMSDNENATGDVNADGTAAVETAASEATAPMETGEESAFIATSEDEKQTVEAAAELVDEYKPLVEALIFASDEPIAFKTLRDILVGEDTGESAPDEDAGGNGGSAPGRGRRARGRRFTMNLLSTIVATLNEEYSSECRVFRIVEIAGGFTFQTTSEYGIWVGRLFAERSRRRLTQSALETLAIIAFRQPVSKPAIEGIRGVNSDFVIKSLLERDLIAIVGRENSVGRPLLYGTTKTFLRHFGLNSLDDLPKPREIADLLVEEENPAAASIEENLGYTDERDVSLSIEERSIFDSLRASEGQELHDEADVERLETAEEAQEPHDGLEAELLKATAGATELYDDDVDSEQEAPEEAQDPYHDLEMELLEAEEEGQDPYDELEAEPDTDGDAREYSDAAAEREAPEAEETKKPEDD